VELANPSKFDRPDRFAKTCQVLPATRIGSIASNLLTTRDGRGKILAVVSNAAYLVTNHGELFWLAREGLPAHSRAILAPFDENMLCVGMAFAARDAHLQIEGRVMIECASVKRWMPAPITPAHAAPPGVVSARVLEVETLTKRATSLPITEIERACHNQDSAAIVAQSEKLIGLGMGLTPAGDDFVGGLLFVAHHLKIAYPGAFRWEPTPINDLLDYARTQTNQIGYAILHDHAHGEGVEPLYNLITAILDHQDRDDITTRARRLLEIGSTSGAEMLAGALTGMLLIENRP
jgi:hypothetical protein